MKKLIFIIFIISGLNLYSQYNIYPKIPTNQLVLNESLVSEAYTWMGVKYSWGGITRKGVDCSAFIHNVYKSALNVSLPRTSREQFKDTVPIQYKDIKKGDLVFFLNNKGVHHVGLIIDEDTFIHASSSRGVRIDSLSKGYWSNKKKKFAKII